jgi:ATP-dependent protease ClpP protease subunit
MTESSFRKIRSDVWILMDEICVQEIIDIYAAITSTGADKEVCLLLDSGGGFTLATYGIIHHIRKKFKTFETRNVGEICSAAVDLLCLAGTLRTSIPTGAFFTHAASYRGKIKDYSAEELAARLKSDRDWAVRQYARRTEKSARFWRSFFEKDRYFDAKEAKRLGIIDRVL